MSEALDTVNMESLVRTCSLSDDTSTPLKLAIVDKHVAIVQSGCTLNNLCKPSDIMSCR